MILQQYNVLHNDLIIEIENYLSNIIGQNVWISSHIWDERLTINSTKILLHPIPLDNLIFKSIKVSIENALNINFDNLKLDFSLCIYLWGKFTNISWHDDIDYPYNGTIYLNKEWDIDDGGIFLWKDNKTKEIKGILPNYNTMVTNIDAVNDKCNYHSVTTISPNVKKERLTLQWRATNKLIKNSLSEKIQYH